MAALLAKQDSRQLTKIKNNTINKKQTIKNITQLQGNHAANKHGLNSMTPEPTEGVALCQTDNCRRMRPIDICSICNCSVLLTFNKVPQLLNILDSLDLPSNWMIPFLHFSLPPLQNDRLTTVRIYMEFLKSVDLFSRSVKALLLFSAELKLSSGT